MGASTLGGFDPRRPGCYLVLDPSGQLGYDLFRRSQSHRLPGLVITRQYPDRVRGDYGLTPDVKVIWLSRAPGENLQSPNAIGPLAKAISQFIEQHGAQAVVLLDGFEYLVVNNGFVQTILLVEQVREFAIQRKAIIIVPLDPRAVEAKELALMERNLTTIDGRDPGALRPPGLVVRLLPKTAATREACARLCDRIIEVATADVDDSAQPLDLRIRIAQRLRIPFVAIVSEGKDPPEIVDVILWTGEQRLMSLSALLDQVARWRKSAG